MQFGHPNSPTNQRKQKVGGPPFAKPQRPPEWGEGLGTPPRGSNSGNTPGRRVERRPCESWHNPVARERVKPLASLPRGVSRPVHTLSTGGGTRRGVGAPLIITAEPSLPAYAGTEEEPAGERERERDRHASVTPSCPLRSKFPAVVDPSRLQPWSHAFHLSFSTLAPTKLHATTMAKELTIVFLISVPMQWHDSKVGGFHE